jgi:hypothetical protein
MGCAPPQLPVLAFATSCCDSKQASNRAARSAQRAGITGALPDELPMPMQSSIARTAAKEQQRVVRPAALRHESSSCCTSTSTSSKSTSLDCNVCLFLLHHADETHLPQGKDP